MTVVATGGTITYDGAYTIHTFTSSGNLVVTQGGDVEYLLVGGGGGGGETIGGGGGGGGVLTDTEHSVSAQTYPIVVGTGGAGGWGAGYPPGTKGGDSSFDSLTAIGGGAGAGYNVSASGTGGSAGGDGALTGNRAGYTVGQGYDGGNASDSNNAAGGGGASEAGESTSGNGGAGGDGVSNSISGSAVTYAGGGGGGVRNGTGGVVGAGGAGGGGAGGKSTAGVAGTDGLGGGGGGGGYNNPTDMAGGDGGDGIVIIKYLTFPEGWTPEIGGSGAIEEENTIVQAGTSSVKITADADHGANPTYITQEVATTVGVKYVLTGYCYGDGKSTITGDSNTDTQTDTGADWDAISIDIIADDTTLTVKLEPYDDSDIAYFDAMVLTSYYPSGWEHTKFIGTMVDINPSSGKFDNPITEIVAHDWIGYLNKQELGLQALASDKRADEALTTILTEFPNQPQATDFDTGLETFEVVFASDSASSSMARMFAKLARNERGRIYSKGDGTLRFEKQGTRDGSQASAFTIDGTMSDINVTYQANNIYNTVSLDIKTQIIDSTADKELFKVGQGIPIAAGQKITLECNFTDPDTGRSVAGVDVVTPVAAPHFGSTRTPANDDMHADLTDDNYQVGATSLTVDLTNGAASTGYLNEFTILGKRLTDYDKITITKTNAASILQVGNSRYTNRLDLIEDPTVAEDIADSILDDYAPSHTSTVRITVLANIDSDLAAQLILAEVSTKFTAIESITGISKDFYIDSLRYKQDHTLLWVTIDAEEA